MTETSKRAGLFVGVGMLIAATSLGAHAASQNTSGGPDALIAQAGGPGGPGFQGGPGGRGRGPGGLGPRGGPMGRGMGPGGPGGMIDLPLGRLNLSAQQQDQVQAIMQSHQDEMKDLGDREMAARNALEAAVSADAIDENAIRSRSADLAAIEADTAVARAHVRGDVLQILTADQRAQAKQIQAGRGGRAGN